MSGECEGKNMWPELVGENGKKAAKIIESENPNVEAIVLPDGTPVTRDFRCDRVWVWVDCNGLVVRPPTIGKLSWPELVGMKGEEAAEIIKQENPHVNPIVWDKPWRPGNYNCYRVFVFVDSDGIVKSPPVAG